jgi:hypothetical protein
MITKSHSPASIPFAELQRGRVDAVSESGGFRPVLEEMAEMGVASAAERFRADHVKAVILL